MSESDEMQRLRNALAGLMPSNAWLMIYLGHTGGPLKTLSPLPTDFQADFARQIARSFELNAAEHVLTSVVVSDEKIARQKPTAEEEACARATLGLLLSEAMTCGRSGLTCNVSSLGQAYYLDRFKRRRWIFSISVGERTVRVCVPLESPEVVKADGYIVMDEIYLTWGQATFAVYGALWASP